MANMLQLIMKNLFNKKPTRHYPLAPERPAFERSRGRIVCNQETCILCTICAKKCPADALTVDRVNGEWKLDAYRCIICGECVLACPKGSISMTNERRHSGTELLFEGFHKEPPKPAAKPAAAQAPKPVPKVEPIVNKDTAEGKEASANSETVVTKAASEEASATKTEKDTQASPEAETETKTE